MVMVAVKAHSDRHESIQTALLTDAIKNIKSTLKSTEISIAQPLSKLLSYKLLPKF